MPTAYSRDGRIRIGNGAGFWGDNLDAPVLLARATAGSTS